MENEDRYDKVLRKLLSKVLELFPSVNKEVWDHEGDENFLNWLRTFKGSHLMEDLGVTEDILYNLLPDEGKGWLDSKIEEAPDLTSKEVMEAIFSTCLIQAANELNATCV